MVEDIQNMKNKSFDPVTKAKILQTTQKATITRGGRAWFNPQAKTNIFSSAEMVKQQCITYNWNTKDAFIVHLPDKIVKFTKTDQGLCI